MKCSWHTLLVPVYSIPHCFNNIGLQSGRLPAYTWSIVDMSIGLAMTNPYISILISFQHLKFCSFTERSAFLTLENSKNLVILGQDYFMAAVSMPLLFLSWRWEQVSVDVYIYTCSFIFITVESNVKISCTLTKIR